MQSCRDKDREGAVCGQACFSSTWSVTVAVRPSDALKQPELEINPELSGSSTRVGALHRMVPPAALVKKRKGRCSPLFPRSPSVVKTEWRVPRGDHVSEQKQADRAPGRQTRRWCSCSGGLEALESQIRTNKSPFQCQIILSSSPCAVPVRLSVWVCGPAVAHWSGAAGKQAEHREESGLATPGSAKGDLPSGKHAQNMRAGMEAVLLTHGGRMGVCECCELKLCTSHNDLWQSSIRPGGEGFDQEHGTQVRGEGHKKSKEVGGGGG
ncbi:hypothetical protein EYF80_001515 [Liparis tanakae]|uniref:Uncharacterized protein n=1 Tax=Liparis tanakae TaxID=230148 RepID=A0A4Z2JDK1_9TELE|nr:hypothetical protein EYF80_001515 [Liparis tanakae]